MKGINVIIRKELKKELRDLSKRVTHGAADYVRDMLVDAAYEAFERFYCDYTPAHYGLGTSYQWKFYKPSGTPLHYDRTYNILENGIRKFEDKRGNIIRGGVEINPDWLKDVYEKQTPQFVFETIYEDGWHGVPNNGIPNMSPTPEEIIKRKYNTIYNSVIDVVIEDEIQDYINGCSYLHY